jgi:CII-binding regulator of phage lambda lysogenization HflD
MMMFNPDQYKTKKKRVMNPDIPRPNLFSHEKKLKEANDVITNLQMQLQYQNEQIQQLKNQYNNMQSSIDRIVGFLRKGK